MASELDFRHVSAAMIEEMRELYGGLDLNAPDMPAAGAADLAPPGGTFLVGYRDSQAVPPQAGGPTACEGSAPSSGADQAATGRHV